MGTFDVQRTGVAIPVCPPRHAALASFLRVADGGEPGLVPSGGGAAGRALAQGLREGRPPESRAHLRHRHAFENLALQGAAMGLVVHGMAGFDRGKTRATLGVPDDYEVEAMVAIGHPGDPAELPPQLQSREVPTPRKPVAEFIREGKFAF